MACRTLVHEDVAGVLPGSAGRRNRVRRSGGVTDERFRTLGGFSMTSNLERLRLAVVCSSRPARILRAHRRSLVSGYFMPAASVIGVILSIGFASPAFGQHRGHVGHRGFGRHSGLRNRSFGHQGRLRPHGLGHQRRLHHRSPGHHLRLRHHSRLRNRSFIHHGGLQHHGLRHHLGLSHRSLGHQGNLHHFGFVTGLTYGARYKKSYHNGRDKPIDSDHVEPDTTNQPELDAPTPLKSGLSYLKHRKYQRA